MRIIAEAGPCDGNLATAIHTAVRAAQAGAWGFKVQMYQADRLTLPSATSYDYGLDTPTTQHEAFQNTIYPYTEWKKVKSVCDDLNIEFFASCWDPEAVDVADALDVNYFKIGSADITHRPLIEHIARTGKQIFLSTGAATLDEIRAAVGWIGGITNRKPVLFACNLAYPTPLDEANLSRMFTLRSEFPGFEVGYSDHTPNPETIWLAAAYQAAYYEKHFTVTPGEPGDHRFAVEPFHLKQMTRWASEARQMIGDPTLAPTETEFPALTHARRSIIAAQDIPKGTRLHPDHFAYLRPGTGIPPSDVYKILGDPQPGPIPLPKKPMKAMVDIPAGTIITWNMIGYVSASLTVE